MFVRKFLSWAATAPAAERAPAAASFARALLDRELPADEDYEAGVALAAFADDPSPLVRRAIAVEIAPRADAPRQIVIALAADQAEIAVPVLRLSPAMTDADLIDAAVVACALGQTAIARREKLSGAVSAALSEIGGSDAVLALLDNEGADIPACALARIVERFETEPAVREALVARPGLDPALRVRLVDATAEALRAFVLGSGWMPAERLDRITRDAREKSYVLLAGEESGPAGVAAVAKRLRESGHLTPALLLRSILSGERALLEAALSELTDIAPGRARAAVEQCDGSAFGALYARAKLPAALLPVFRSALAALAAGAGRDEFADGGLQRSLVEHVLAFCEKSNVEGAGPVLGLLRRFLAEAARQEAREFSAWIARTEAMAGLQSPDTQTPDSQTPELQTPELQAPELQRPGFAPEAPEIPALRAEPDHAPLRVRPILPIAA